MGQSERRRHPRLPIRLPIAHRVMGAEPPNQRHDFTIDIAAGGVYFSVTDPPPDVGQKLQFELAIPPGEGHFPYAGKIRGLATVTRREPFGFAHGPEPVEGPLGAAAQRWTVAASFDKPLDLEF